MANVSPALVLILLVPALKRTHTNVKGQREEYALPVQMAHRLPWLVTQRLGYEERKSFCVQYDMNHVFVDGHLAVSEAGY